MQPIESHIIVSKRYVFKVDLSRIRTRTNWIWRISRILALLPLELFEVARTVFPDRRHLEQPGITQSHSGYALAFVVLGVAACSPIRATVNNR